MYFYLYMHFSSFLLWVWIFQVFRHLPTPDLAKLYFSESPPRPLCDSSAGSSSSSRHSNPTGSNNSLYSSKVTAKGGPLSSGGRIGNMRVNNSPPGLITLLI
mmetsp:Transcript_9029/g.15010  ORF Transcript_9029/g.15010 Transcript_9029/m.15010 type:complete len:102 (+) Transcript_9029:68-373(+)